MDVAGVFRGIGYARYWQKETRNRNKRLCFIICLAGNYVMQPDMDGWRPLSGPAHKFTGYNPGFVGSTEDNSLVSPTLQLTSFPP